MGSAVNDLVTLVRALIPELDPVEWTNARLVVHMDKEYKEWAADLGMLPGPGWFTIIDTFTLPANATTYALTGLLNPTTEGNFAAIKSVWYLPESGDPVRIENAAPGNETRYQLAVGQDPVGQVAPRRRWLTRPAGVPTLNFGPQSSVDRSFQAYIRYEPPTLAVGGTVQTDPRHDDVLVLGTALRALLETSETDPVIKDEYLGRRLKFLEAERMAAGEHESETTKVAEGGSEAMFGEQ